MRVVVATLLLAACYDKGEIAPCTVSCDQAPCPGDLVCGSDFVCQTAGMPSCTAQGIGTGLYITAPNGDPGDYFGNAVAISADGEWLVVGAPREASNAVGINGSQMDNTLPSSGAAYVYRFDGSTYVFQTYIKSPAPDQDDNFGSSVAISATGNVLAIGAPNEDGNGLNNTGDPNDNSSESAGAVYVWTRDSTSAPWMLHSYLKPSGPGVAQYFGWSVSITADGQGIAVGAVGARHSALLCKPFGNYVAQGGPVPNGDDNDRFGSSIAVSRDGGMMFVGEEVEDGSSTGVSADATAANDAAQDAGAVRSYDFAAISSVPYFKASNTGAGDNFGRSVATDLSGTIVAVGAPGEDGNGSSEGDESTGDAGAVYVFEHTGATWTSTYVKATNPGAADNFGRSVAVTPDAAFLVVGAPGEASADAADPSNDSLPRSGAVYTFTKGTSTWEPARYLKAPNALMGDELGSSVAVSDDHQVVVSGARHRENDKGAVYVFR